MRENKFGFAYKIRNRQFKTLFLKNWIQVFGGIVIPLVLCMSFARLFSEQSLLREMDIAAKRSTSNTVTTIHALMEEVFNNLEQQAVNESVISFLRMERTVPQRYGYITAVNEVQEIIKEDYRENLYHSIDVYSEIGDYVISTRYSGTAYVRFQDKNLVETFYNHLNVDSKQAIFAVSRTVTGNLEESKKVITFYKGQSVGKGKRSFVSISVDSERLIKHITDNHDSVLGAYLIIDQNNRVILDTSNKMNDQYVEFVENTENPAITAEMNGEMMRISWMPMNWLGWKCIQMVPMRDFQQSNVRLRNLILTIAMIGIVLAAGLSYGITNRLYRPVEAILQVLENPTEQIQIGDEDGEIHYMLMTILELFQKNMTLEQEMVDRIIALRRARAKALQEQMMPHFLGNVLQAINWTAIIETGSENSMTSQSLILLADILGTSKSQTSNITTVAGEIEYTRKFLKLECLRYGPNIRCSYDIDPVAEQRPIPCISLQTLVENSINHGFQPRKAIGNIYISVYAIEKNGLHICVDDDGVGFDQVMIDKIFDMLEREYVYVGNHLGIINLFQRFRLIYGDKCEFKIHKSTYGGACVEIKTPNLPEWWGWSGLEKDK